MDGECELTWNVFTASVRLWMIFESVARLKPSRFRILIAGVALGSGRTTIIFAESIIEILRTIKNPPKRVFTVLNCRNYFTTFKEGLPEGFSGFSP